MQLVIIDKTVKFSHKDVLILDGAVPILPMGNPTLLMVMLWAPMVR